MVRLTADILALAPSRINPLGERELELRGIKAPAIENLSVLMDGYDAIDLTGNEISKLENFPLMKRLRTLYISNNRISRVEEGLGNSLPYLETLVMTGNRVSDLTELGKLASLSNLVSLSLLQNPVTRRPNYRWYVAWQFPHLRVLDFQRVTSKERKAAQSFFRSKAGKTFIAEIKTAAAAAFVPVTASAAAVADSGAGGQSGTDAAGARSATFTAEELSAIHAAIADASTNEEIERLERYLKAGTCPPELRQKGAHAVQPPGGDVAMADGE